MQEAGFIEHWRKHWWNASNICSSSLTTQTATPTHLSSLIGCIVVAGVSGIVALLAFIVEINIGYKNKAQKYINNSNAEVNDD